jgi:cysteine-rich repeat protein
LADGDFFGSAAISPRDLDGDGIVDLVVGARRDDDGALNTGAIWVLFLDGVPGALCGDEILDPGEDCDDGNNANGDCCDSACQYEVNGASCSDANVCNGSETCNGTGTCLPGAPLNCDDGQACTQDSCHPVNGCSSTTGPAPVCMLAAKRSISIADRSPDTKDKLSWKWVKGEETFYADFGNPLNTDSYTLCIYDESAGVPALKAELTVPNGSNWTTNGTKVWTYKDSDALSAGVRSVKLVAGANDKAKVIVKAKGAQLGAELPGPVGATYFNQDGDVIVQLINSLDFCWSTDLPSPAVVNEDDSFKDKLP